MPSKLKDQKHPKETHNEVSIGWSSPHRADPSQTQLPWHLEMLPLQSLRPAKRNARTHSKKQIQEIANSILRFGYINPIVIDQHNQLVAGHARFEAAKSIRLSHVPVIRLKHLSDIEIRAYMLADNKLASKAGWDRSVLAIELGELQVSLPEVNLEVGITGFEPAEIDTLMLDFAESSANAADEIPDLERGNWRDIAVRRRDDAGDALKTKTFRRQTGI
jgi:ParB-like chromosome segregation protein Spo0J